mgnify:CR=1 FL=1
MLKISEAVVPEAIKSFPIVTTFLSAFCSIVDRSFTIETVSIVLDSISNVMFPKFISLLSSDKLMVLDASLYPIKFTFNTKLFNSKFLISKLPSSFVETPATGLVPSKTLTVEKLTGSFVVLSIIFPETTPSTVQC